MLTMNDVRNKFYELAEECLTVDTRAEDRDKLNLIMSGMKLMSDAVIELIELDTAVDEEVHQ